MGTAELSVSHGALIRHKRFYASHIRTLLGTSQLWVRRRVISFTIVDGDTLQIRVSLDFDLTECDAGLRYLQMLKTKNLPMLLPLGLYPDPYVGFDLRDCAESRVSLINKGECDAIVGEMRRLEGGGRLSSLLSFPHLVIAKLPSDYRSGRGILHYTYLRRWQQDKETFSFLPPTRDEKRDIKRPSFRTKEFWRWVSMLIGWRPIRVMIPLLNAHLCNSYHVELHTPEGIRVHRPDIITELLPSKEQKSVAKRKDDNTNKRDETKDVPPSHTYAVLHYQAGGSSNRHSIMDPTLVFRAWLSLDHRGHTTPILFLALLNWAVGAAALAALVLGRLDTAGIVPLEVITAVASFAYLYVPGEHGLNRGLFNPVRWILVAAATAALTVAGTLTILRAHEAGGQFGIHGSVDLLGFVVALAAQLLMTVCALVLIRTWRRARDERVRAWVTDHLEKGDYKQFGWHVIGSSKLLRSSK